MADHLDRTGVEDDGELTDLLGVCAEGCHVVWTAYLGDGTVLTRRIVGRHAVALGNALIQKGKLVEAEVGRQGKH